MKNKSKNRKIEMARGKELDLSKKRLKIHLYTETKAQ